MSADEERLAAQLDALARDATFDYAADGQRWLAPVDAAGLAEACAAHPDARLVAGATDVGLWVTKQHRDLGTMISTLGGARPRAACAATTTASRSAPRRRSPTRSTRSSTTTRSCDEAWIRFASAPIRNAGTLGGNVANGSPIGDSMPALIALGATVVLRKGDATSHAAARGLLPRLPEDGARAGRVRRVASPCRAAPTASCCARTRSRSASTRTSRRPFAAFALVVDDGRIASARIGCGGVAATPKRAVATERALARASRGPRETAETRRDALEREFTPIDDMRASAAYRRRALGNLVRRLWLETGGDGDAHDARRAGARTLGEP